MEILCSLNKSRHIPFSSHSGNANFTANKADNNVAVVVVAALLVISFCRLFGLWLLHTSDHTWLLAEHLPLPARVLTTVLPAVGRLLVCCFYVHATFKFRSRGTLIVRRRLAVLPLKVSDTSAYKLHVAGGIGVTAFSARTRYLSWHCVFRACPAESCQLCCSSFMPCLTA